MTRKPKYNPREKVYRSCPTCKSKLQRKLIDRRRLLHCPRCGFVFWNNPKPVVSIIIEKNKKILMLKRAEEPLKDYWVLPGGFIDYEENAEQATIRETEEETGLKIKLKGLVGVYQIDNDPRGNNIDIIYCGEISKEKIKINEESLEYKFFALNHLPRPIAYKHRQAIKDWQKSKTR